MRGIYGPEPLLFNALHKNVLLFQISYHLSRRLESIYLDRPSDRSNIHSIFFYPFIALQVPREGETKPNNRAETQLLRMKRSLITALDRHKHERERESKHRVKCTCEERKKESLFIWPPEMSIVIVSFSYGRSQEQ